MRVVVILEYDNGAYQFIDYIGANEINKFLDYKDLLWKPHHPFFGCHNSGGHEHNRNTYNQLLQPNTGDIAYPNNVKYPERIHFSFNGAINWSSLRVELGNLQGLTTKDWRKDRIWSKNPFTEGQLKCIDPLSRWLTISPPLGSTVAFVVNSKADGCYNRYGSSGMYLITRNSKTRRSDGQCDDEAQLIEYCSVQHVGYVDTAGNVIVSPFPRCDGNVDENDDLFSKY